MNSFKERIIFERCVIVLAGLPLTGKSTLVRELAKQSNLVPLDVDEARWEVFSRRETPLLTRQERFAMLVSYQKNHERARNHLSNGEPVVLAATYSGNFYHEMLAGLTQNMSCPLRVFLLETSEVEIQKRLRQRGLEDNLSNIKSLERYLEVKKGYQVMEGARLTRINTDNAIEDCVTGILQASKDLVLLAPELNNRKINAN